MSSNVIFFGWNRPVSGQEQKSAALFMEFLQYLGGLQGAGAIDSFETVLLGPHGGDLNGFILIRGDRSQLNDLSASDQWLNYLTQAGILLEGAGEIRGVRDEGVMEWMQRYNKLLSG